MCFYCDMYMFLMLWKLICIKLILKFFCVNNIDGLIIIGFLGFVEIGYIGLEFMIVVILYINVYNILWVSFLVLVLSRRELRIFFVILIIFFYDLVICDVWGGLKVYLVLFVDRNFFIGLDFI